MGGKRFYHHKQLEEVRTKFGTNKIELNEETIKAIFAFVLASSAEITPSVSE